MRSWRILTFVTAAVALSVATPRVVQGCDCIGLKPLSTDIRREVPVIFSGTVVEIVERNEHITTTVDGGATTSVKPIERHVVFRVMSGWQGVTQDRLSVNAGVTNCMFAFEIGRAYIVFAYLDAQGHASTNMCLRTRALDEAAEVLRLLGPPSYVAGDASRRK
jgi:hypothetical protein